MNPPKWFWFVLAACLVTATACFALSLRPPRYIEWVDRENGLYDRAWYVDRETGVQKRSSPDGWQD